MKFGKVLTYKDVDEAEKLVGKKVVASDFYASICNDDTACDCVHDTLKAVHADKVCPFECITFCTQFIREILPNKPEYEPYDLSDKKVRDSLRGRWFMGEYGYLAPARDFYSFKNSSVWYVNGYSPKDFLKKCKWLGGAPCGRRADKDKKEEQE